MKSNPILAAQLAQQLNQTQQQYPCLPVGLRLVLPGYALAIRSNSAALLNSLAEYFDLTITSNLAPADTEILAIETDDFLEIGQNWQDWPREAGKTGRKETFLDAPETQQGRFIFKVKTGMLFWQKPLTQIAVGSVERHPNQVINFALSQYLNHHLRQGWLLGHAAGLQIDGKGIAIAGLSGGGKSTLMLHLLEQGQHFISNDRLLIQAGHPPQTTLKTTRPGVPFGYGQFYMRGIPKQPRINPGTIVHNPRLHSLIPAEQRHQLLALSASKLRHLEQKYDADVNQLFHSNCAQAESPLDLLVILNWSAQSEQSTQAQLTTLAQSPKLLPALIKSAGPFFADAQGQFLAHQTVPDAKDYLNQLATLPCLEISGKLDFSKAQQAVLKHLQAV